LQVVILPWAGKINSKNSKNTGASHPILSRLIAQNVLNIFNIFIVFIIDTYAYGKYTNSLIACEACISFISFSFADHH